MITNIVNNITHHVKYIALAVVLASAAFIACDYSNLTEICIKDLGGLLSTDGKKEILAPTTIRFEVSSTDTCQKEKENLTALLGQYYADLKNPRCFSQEFKSYISFEARIPLVIDTADNASNKSALIVFVAKKDGGSISVAIHVNRSSYSSLSASIYNKYYQRLEAKGFFVEINFINDATDGVSIEGKSIYLNGTPCPESCSISLNHRDRANVNLSTVLVDFVLNKEPMTVFRITIPQIPSTPVAPVQAEPAAPGSPPATEEKKNEKADERPRPR